MTGGQEILHLLQVCLISLLLPINLARTKSPNMSMLLSWRNAGNEAGFLTYSAVLVDCLAFLA